MPTLSSDTTRSAPLSGTPTVAKSSGNEPQKDGSLICTCGKETFGCSIHPNTRDEWIASMRASLARILASPDIVLGSERIREAVSTAKSSESLTWYDQSSCSWKTSQRSFTTDLEPFSETWPRVGMMRDGAVYELPTLERITGEIDGGYWPTPTVAAEAPNLGSNKKNGPRSLIQVAREMWPTPCSPGGGGTNGKAKMRSMLWPTPDANMNRGTQQDWKPVRDSGQPATYTINQAVRDKTWPKPRANSANGAGEHGQGGKDLQTEVGGMLHSRWVAWLMNWPLTWCDVAGGKKSRTLGASRSRKNTGSKS